VITRTKIDLGENFGSSQLIKKNINSGKRIFVSDGHCIERSVVKKASSYHLSFRQREWDNPKEKNSGECSPYLTAFGVGFSIQLVLWEAYDKVV
jgi:hypothetical protein